MTDHLGVTSLDVLSPVSERHDGRFLVRCEPCSECPRDPLEAKFTTTKSVASTVALGCQLEGDLRGTARMALAIGVIKQGRCSWAPGR